MSTGKSNNLLRTLGRSDVLVAMLVFLLLDLVVRVGTSCQPKQCLGFNEPYRSRPWWAAKAFKDLKTTPDLILLGASDMTCAFYGAEANNLNTTVSQLLTFQSDYLQKKLRQSDAPYQSNFCLGIPGEMPCDAYFLITTLLADKPKPKAIFFSVTMRDFCDATFGDPSSSNAFKVMSKLGGAADSQLSCRSSLWDTLDYEAGQACSIYGHRWECMSLQHSVMHYILGNGLGFDFDKIDTTMPLRTLALKNLPEDYGPNEVLQGPSDDDNPKFTNNLSEYAVRYRSFQPKVFKQQVAFLKKLADYCKAEGITFVVANTPITPENRAMIPVPIYNSYYSTVSDTVRTAGGIFVDFDTPTVFKHTDFFDTVHLNGKGGQKFLTKIAQTLSTSSSLAQSHPIQPSR